jgi:hypothetical protein
VSFTKNTHPFHIHKKWRPQSSTFLKNSLKSGVNQKDTDTALVDKKSRNP